MKLKKAGLLALVLALVLGALPIGGTAAKKEKKDVADMDIPAILEDVDAKGTINVYHWWTAGGEKDAVESVVNDFSDSYSNIRAKSNAIPGGAGGAMVMKVKVLQQAGKSPETFQAHPGQEIEPYLSSNLLLNLNDVWEYANLAGRALPGMEELSTASDGNKYIVPIGIHKTNVIFYNIHVFEKYGVEVPDHEDITWDEFWAICDQLAAAMPDGEYPLDLGDRKGWPACQVFEDIMLGTDAQIYENFINGIYSVEEVTSVLSTYAKLMDYVAPDHSSRDWYEASGQVVAGTYAMQIMGAWMQPLMTSMGQVYGEDYGVFTFPGTDGWFGMCIDGFVVSNDSADVEGGVRWAYNVSTPSVQTAFSTLKESISPYSDTPDEIYNALTLRFKNELIAESTKVYPSFTHGTALPWSASTSLQVQIQEFATSSDHDAEYFANRIVNILKESGVKGDWNLVE
ncbi:MAG TPA: ABC transporter substrate-binding protein [Clostridia bacterium]|jgi:glucose/mannose transport system substrate-binding protein|nr:ABC transporter substrate-binding protein [Clostridia bacterium]HPY42852.1 ABC transporter substrate-binding protein [Clostridia bacterium]HQA96350.1 ABC transporter substrate-binding protein [Clostridia bacterium]HQO56157.1 ABC transporter substrate-binding protein [Clostridia bacterium]HUM61519.1 ABC transporter substrate-binding protein [Clostridia bacterium]